MLLLGTSQCHPLLTQLLVSLIFLRRLDPVLDIFGRVLSLIAIIVFIAPLEGSPETLFRRLHQAFSMLVAGCERSVLAKSR